MTVALNETLEPVSYELNPEKGLLCLLVLMCFRIVQLGSVN